MEKQRYEHFGKQGRDVVTGFTGTITAICTYWTGCEQLQVVPPISDDGEKREGIWFDLQRIEVLDEEALTLPVASAPDAGPRHSEAPPSRD